MKLKKTRIRRDSTAIAEKAESLRQRAALSEEGSYALLGEVATRALEELRPETSRTAIAVGDLADARPIDELFSSMEADLSGLEQTTKKISEALVATYNAVASRMSEVGGLMDTAFSRLASLGLYKDARDPNLGVLLYDFSDSSELDVGSSCVMMEDISSLTLPVDSIEPVEVATAKVVTQGSNGAKGNNYDRSRARNGVIENAIDGDVSTWFEYESIDGPGDLVLVMEMILGEPEVANQMTIVPVNFGEGEPFTIDRCEVSSGGVYTDLSVSDGALDMAGERVLAGREKVIPFFPRPLDSVRLTIRQTKGAWAQGGRYFRRAIGLKNVALSRVKYKAEGEFTLSQRVMSKAVSTVAFEGAFLDRSYGSEVRVDVSSDGGETFNTVSLLSEESGEDPEILPLKALASEVMIKGRMRRDGEAFATALARENSAKEYREELIPLPSASSPHSLSAEPTGPVALMVIGEGRVGHDNAPTFIGLGGAGLEDGAASRPQIFYIRAPYERGALKVMVNEEEWTEIDSLGHVGIRGYVYNASAKRPHIIFGDGDPTGAGGMAVPAGARVTVAARPDRGAGVKIVGQMAEIEPTYFVDRMSTTTKVFRRDIQDDERSFKIAPGIRDLDARDAGITSLIRTNDADGDFTEVPYLDGRTEFTAPRQVSLSEDGVVYLSEPALAYTYVRANTRRLHPVAEFSFDQTRNRIIIRAEDLVTAEASQRVNADPSLTYLDVDLPPGTSIIKGSLRASGFNTDLAATLEKELEFIDGVSEFEALSGDKLGYFSVSYRDARLYLPSADDVAGGRGGLRNGVLVSSITSLELRYGIGRMLRSGVDFQVADRKLTISAGAISTELNEVEWGSSQGRLLATYEALPPGVGGGEEMADYFSPLLDKLIVYGNSIDPRIGRPS